MLVYNYLKIPISFIILLKVTNIVVLLLLNVAFPINNDTSIPCPVVMVTFGLAEVFVNEGDNGSVCVNVTGQLERQVAISVSISGATASTGLDHDFPASTLFSFNSSPDTYCISFNATQDAIYENDETFSVGLDSSDPQVNTGAVNTVSIFDKDEGLYQ